MLGVFFSELKLNSKSYTGFDHKSYFSDDPSMAYYNQITATTMSVVV